MEVQNMTDFEATMKKKQYKVADVKNSQKWVASIAPTK